MTTTRWLFTACLLCLALHGSGASASTVSWTEMPNWATPPSLGTRPTVADLNGDGRPDLMVAGYWHGFRNDGGCSGPFWSLADEWCVGLPILVATCPELCDLDDDGDADILVGGWYGEVLFYENTGTPQSPVWMRNDAYFYHQWSNSRAPGSADLDGDGDLDIVSGSTNPVALLVHWNDGTPASPIWREDTTFFSDIPLSWLGHSTDPNFADLDEDGDLDLVTAPNWPAIMHAFENAGPGSNPMWVPNDDLLMGVERPERPYGAALRDLNCDGRADLIVSGRFAGSSVSETRCYRNDGPVTAVESVTWGRVKALFR